VPRHQQPKNSGGGGTRDKAEIDFEIEIVPTDGTKTAY
jgi:hypothetical protein